MGVCRMSVRGRGVCMSGEGMHVPEKVVMSCYTVNILRWDVNTCPCVCTLLLTSALPYLALFPVLLLPLLSCFASVLQFSICLLFLLFCYSLCVLLFSMLYCVPNCSAAFPVSGVICFPPHTHSHTHTPTHSHTHTFSLCV